jgi:hypothetical protein
MGSLEPILIKMKANMEARQGKMEVNQEEMVTTRAGQEKLEVAINAIQYVHQKTSGLPRH